MLIDLKGYMLLTVEGGGGCEGALREAARGEQVVGKIGHPSTLIGVSVFLHLFSLGDGVERLRGDHGVEHGNGEECVGARQEHGTPCAACFEGG